MDNGFSGWRKTSAGGVWSRGPRWARPIVAAAPWIGFALVLGAISLVQGRATAAPGTVFDLPPGNCTEGDAAELVALVLPQPGQDDASAADTLVFFDDARYILSDAASRDALAEAISTRAAASRTLTLLAMVDRRVVSGEMMAFVNLARANGIRHIQVAEKK